jgi:hypothetical protein
LGHAPKQRVREARSQTCNGPTDVTLATARLNQQRHRDYDDHPDYDFRWTWQPPPLRSLDDNREQRKRRKCQRCHGDARQLHGCEKRQPMCGKQDPA